MGPGGLRPDVPSAGYSGIDAYRSTRTVLSAASVISQDMPRKADNPDGRQCILEQFPLNAEAHETVRHVQADQSRMERFALHQGREVRPVMGHLSSRSTSSPRRSWNDRASLSGAPSCSAKAVAMAVHRSWWSLSTVG